MDQMYATNLGRILALQKPEEEKPVSVRRPFSPYGRRCPRPLPQHRHLRLAPHARRFHHDDCRHPRSRLLLSPRGEVGRELEGMMDYKLR